MSSGAPNTPTKGSLLSIVYNAPQANVDITPVAFTHPPENALPDRAPTRAVASHLKALGSTSNGRWHEEVASSAHEWGRGLVSGDEGGWRGRFKRPRLIAASVNIHGGNSSFDG